MNSSQEAVNQLNALMDQVDEHLKDTFQILHQGYPTETLVRFLKAREWNVSKAHKMLVDCLNWRLQNDIDNILSKPIIPIDLYRAVRDSQLVGLSGFSKEVLYSHGLCTQLCGENYENTQGVPVFGIGVGLSTLDRASVNYYVQSHIQINEYRDRVVLPAASELHGRYIGTCLKVLDMTGLKLSALGQIKLLTIISTVDDLNYPEKTDVYYIVNAPYIFSACWRVVRPLLQERTRKKVQVLHGSGRDELLKIMDYASLPHFCKKEGPAGSSQHLPPDINDCFSLDHPFHQEVYNYVKQQAQSQALKVPVKLGSFHVDVPEPDPEGTMIVQTIKSELHKIGDQNGDTHECCLTNDTG